MRFRILLLGVAILAGCDAADKDQSAALNEAAAKLMLPPEGEKIQLIKDLPKSEIRCEFKNRTICAGGSECVKFPNKAGTYTLIDIAAKSYKRCDKSGCNDFMIDGFGSPQGIRDISLGSIGTIVKLGPGNRFVDVATQGAFVYISDGICTPTEIPN
jgi:hypothetical protein